MNKPAEVQHEIHEVLKNRWSPRAFSSRPVEPDKVLSLFEAARWAPSGGNTQPWAFIVGLLGDETHQRLLEVMHERNAAWAKNAPVLALSIANVERKPGVPNPYALYDVGQAVAHLTVQAHALGLHAHQMAGFDPEKARQVFALPEGYNPVTITVIGYQGDLDQLSDELREREIQPRTRKPLSDFVFSGHWAEPLNLDDPELVKVS